MSDLMLHGVLNMPLPDDPTELDVVTWLQFKDRARQASSRIEELEAKLDWVIVERDETFALMLDRALLQEIKLAKAVEAAFQEDFLAGTEDGWVNNPRIKMEWKHSRARTTLAELTGGKDE